MTDERVKQRPFWRNPVVLVAVIVLAVCLGIPLVGSVGIMLHWSAKERSGPDDIAKLLHDDLGLALPAGTTIVNSYRVPMGMDSAGAYELNIPAAAVSEFVEQIKAAAKKPQWQVAESSLSPLMQKAPQWWAPEAAGITTWLHLTKEQDAYEIGISSTTGRCFVYWMTF